MTEAHEINGTIQGIKRDLKETENDGDQDEVESLKKCITEYQLLRINLEKDIFSNQFYQITVFIYSEMKYFINSN